MWPALWPSAACVENQKYKRVSEACCFALEHACTHPLLRNFSETFDNGITLGFRHNRNLGET